MSFVLKIFFSGLIAFLPNADGTELTVLLINTPHEYALADGTPLAHHMPMLLARAAGCDGCENDDRGKIAPFLFPEKLPGEGLIALNGALAGGGAFVLDGADLSLIGPKEPLSIRMNARARLEGKPDSVPRSAAQREDFTWLASLQQIAPDSGGFKAAVTAPEAPPPCLIAARLKLRSGKVFTYAVVKIDGQVRPVHFRRPSGAGPEAPYTQALASWMAAEVQVPGDSLQIVSERFDDPKNKRSITLRPAEKVVELALLNIPSVAPPVDLGKNRVPAPGQHFQIYYDLVKKSPARADRVVPYQALEPLAAEPQIDWGTLHPRAAMWSNLLEGIRLGPRGKRSLYELAFCPMIRP
jgi:hypothetical protein